MLKFISMMHIAAVYKSFQILQEQCLVKPDIGYKQKLSMRALIEEEI